MSEEIIKVLDELAKRFGIAIDWTSENVLPYVTDLCDRIVKYSIATNIVFTMCSVIVFASCIIAFIAIFNSLKKAENTEKDTFLWEHHGFHNEFIELKGFGFGIVLASSICLPFATLAIVIGIQDLLKTIYLPEVVILDMIQRYM